MNLLEFMRQMLPEGLERDAVADRFLLLRLEKEPGERWGMVCTQKWRDLWEIKGILPDSPASRSKLQVHDLLCSANGARLKDAAQVRKAFGENKLSIVAFRPLEVPNLVRWEDLLHSLEKKRAQDQPQAEEEIQVVGVKTRSRKRKVVEVEDMPHARSCCMKIPYIPCHYVLRHADGAQYVVTRMTNEQYCEDCYCSLCSVPAKVCSKWSWHCQISLQVDEKRAADYLTNRLAGFADVVQRVE